MDAIDNLIFATLQSPLHDGTNIASEFIPTVPVFAGFAPGNTTPAGVFNPVFNFSVADKMTYTGFLDSSIIDKAILRHWYDVNNAGNYNWPGIGVVSDFAQSTNYHLIYAYLIENTRIIQIFEKLIEKYATDEEFGIATNFPQAFQWFLNTERLFFKNNSSSIHNNRSIIRPNSEATRRNAYFRMFGMDLAFGDTNTVSGGSFPYHKAKVSNQQFIVLLERFLAEVWQGFSNARNTSGQNTTDVNHITDLAVQLQELLYARRGARPGGGPNLYAVTNLSQEEYAAVILVSWFAFIISDNTPVVQFLNCQSTTIGERLIKIGNAVGIPSHSKSQSIFEMAGSLSNILSLIEAGSTLNNPGFVTTMLSSLNPPIVPSLEGDIMNNFLLVINNWEKATGHRIKNPEAKLNGTLKIDQKTPRPVLVTN